MSNVRWLAKDVGVIDGFLSGPECDEYVGWAETQGFEDAPVTTEQGMIIMKDLRNNDRVMVDDTKRAGTLYDRLSDSVPQRIKKKWIPAGLNERLRIYRYDPGQRFDWHHDGYFERSASERSFFTFMVYLNDEFEGGGTSFAEFPVPGSRGADLTVIPAKGMALLFYHPLLHRGDAVTAGRKYVLRTDVMYMRKNTVQTGPRD